MRSGGGFHGFRVVGSIKRRRGSDASEKLRRVSPLPEHPLVVVVTVVVTVVRIRVVRVGVVGASSGVAVPRERRPVPSPTHAPLQRRRRERVALHQRLRANLAQRRVEVGGGDSQGVRSKAGRVEVRRERREVRRVSHVAHALGYD